MASGPLLRSARSFLGRGLAAAAVVSCLSAAAARGQVALDPYQPAPLPDDGFVLARPISLAAREWSVLAGVDYANDPLAYTLTRGPGLRQVVVSDHVVVQLAGALGLKHGVTLFANLPIHALMRGDQNLLVPNTAPDGAGLGDLALAARVALPGSRLFAWAAEVVARLPTARMVQRDQRYSGDQIGSYEGALVGELRKSLFAARLRLGLRFRKEIDMLNLQLGQALLFGTGARVELPRDVSLHAELSGSTYLAQAFDRYHTPLELLLGCKYRYGRLWLGAAAGPGLVDGYGSPDFRVLATLGVAQQARARETPGAHAAAAASDIDRDTVVDAADGCPAVAEDRDGFEDEDGCPEHDDDRDGVADGTDRCPRAPEDRDAFEDLDGCPDADDDRDGIADSADRCPRETGGAETQGCPAPAEGAELTVEFGHVEFARGKEAASLPSNLPTLQAVESILARHPQIRRTLVEGHANDTRNPHSNLELSKRRARAVAVWLIAHGVVPARLELKACGDRYPVEEQASKQDQRSRRVEFHVVDPAPSTPLEHRDCEPIQP
jgi:outer membrane protein OmpA-like peptidoglycan-associated protein